MRPNTGHILRVQHRLLQPPSQSPPRRLAGHLTVPQLARTLEVPVHWLDDHLHRGTLAVTKDPTTGVSGFPDQPHTLQMFQDLTAGTRQQRRWHEAPPSGSDVPDAVEKGL